MVDTCRSKEDRITIMYNISTRQKKGSPHPRIKNAPSAAIVIPRAGDEKQQTGQGGAG
jgi:hypothetical protein